jgi:hypothetical protein
VAINNGKLLILATLASTMFLSSCEQKLEEAAIDGVTAGVSTGITTAVQDLKNSRQLVETFGRDIKKTYNPNDEIYNRAEVKYSAARSAFNGYFTALRFAALSDEPTSDLSAIAEDATRAITDFVALSAQQLDPTLNMRRIPLARAVRLPTALPPQIKKVPQKQRQAVLQDLEGDITWTPWSQI